MAKEILSKEQQYQHEYYLRRTKKKREEQRQKNPYITKTCVVCGKKFKVPRSSAKRITCSEECRIVRHHIMGRVYRQSEQGKKIYKAYRTTEKFKNWHKTYQSTEKRRAYQREYYMTHYSPSAKKGTV